MLSESQWEVIDYCTDCSAILCEMNGKLKWTPVKCPYSGGNHHTETDYQEESLLKKQEFIMESQEAWDEILNRR